MSEDSSNGQGVAWFLAGLGVGALIGILYAPKSGRETREDLAQGAREGSEYLRARGRQAAERAGQMVDKGKEQVNQYVGRGREVVERGRAQWEDFVERGKNMRNVLASLPAGEWQAEDFLDDDGVIPGPISIRVKVSNDPKRRRAVVDFAGTHDVGHSIRIRCAKTLRVAKSALLIIRLVGCLVYSGQRGCP